MKLLESSQVRKFLTILIGTLSISSLYALADDSHLWPTKPIKYVVPWPAGGPTDTFGRALAAEMAKQLGQPVIVENRSGATGAIGIQSVARSAPDGYTLLAPNITAFIGNPVVNPDKVNFDPLNDFVPIALFVETSVVLWAHSSTELHNFNELLSRAHTNQGQKTALSFGTTGSGSVSEQSVEQLARHYQLDLLKVPYQGTAPQLADLVAGHINLGAADYALASGYYNSGQLVPLLVIGKHRLPELPNTPTNYELGIKEPDFTIWNGLFVPTGTPPAIITRLRDVTAQAVQSDVFRKIAEGKGNRVIFQTGEEARTRLRQELESRQQFQASVAQKP